MWKKRNVVSCVHRHKNWIVYFVIWQFFLIYTVCTTIFYSVCACVHMCATALCNFAKFCSNDNQALSDEYSIYRKKSMPGIIILSNNTWNL